MDTETSEKVIEMRQKPMSYGLICKETGLSIKQVRTICNKAGLGGKSAPNGSTGLAGTIDGVATLRGRKIPRTEKECIDCGRLFSGVPKSKRCPICAHVAANHRYRNTERRLEAYGMSETPRDRGICWQNLMERDGGICQICGEAVDVKDYRTNENGYKVFGSRYPSVDHVKSLKNGGFDTWDNVQLAHIGCNSRKNAS